jgi:arylsulfatase
LFWEHEGNRAVLAGRWKIVADDGHPWELYDLESDRTELHDLAAFRPEMVADLAAKYDAWAARTGVLPWDEVRGKLRSIK